MQPKRCDTKQKQLESEVVISLAQGSTRHKGNALRDIKKTMSLFVKNNV